MARGTVPCHAVDLEQWLIAHAWSMVSSNSPKLKRKMMIDGNVYNMTFTIEGIMYSEHVNNLMGAEH